MNPRSSRPETLVELKGITKQYELGRTRVDAEIPGIELTRYATDLRSLAHGTGTFTRVYAKHAPMPQHQADKILAGS